MIVRIGVFEGLDHEDRDWVIEAAREIPGVHSVFHVVDKSSGRWLSVGVFESVEAVQDAAAAIAARRRELGRSSRGPDREEVYEVVRGFARTVDA